MKYYTLLLSSTFESIKFISERRAIKLYVNDKIEPLYDWDYKITYEKGSFNLPSIVRLKNTYRKFYHKTIFNRDSLISRDKRTCQYCGFKLCSNEITIDHIVPLSKGGQNSFTNCVVACRPCNDYKSDLDLDKCGLKLIKPPQDPGYSAIYTLPYNYKNWNKDWDNFINVM